MKDYVKNNQKVYDRLAQEYKERRKDYIVSERKIAAPFINYLKRTFDKIRILELGPGSGLNLSYFLQENFKTTAIDISQKIIDVARQIAPKTEYIHDEFLEHDFRQTKYEGIFAKAFIHLFPKKDAILVLKKIKALLVPGGAVFVATTVHPKSEEGFFEKKDYAGKLKRFRKMWTEKELLDLISALGFKIIDKGYHIEEDKEKIWINLVIIK